MLNFKNLKFFWAAESFCVISVVQILESLVAEIGEEPKGAFVSILFHPAITATQKPTRLLIGN